MLLRAGPLAHQLTFDVCASLGASLIPEGSWFDVDMTALCQSAGREGLFSDRVVSTWENRLGSGIPHCLCFQCILPARDEFFVAFQRFVLFGCPSWGPELTCVACCIPAVESRMPHSRLLWR